MRKISPTKLSPEQEEALQAAILQQAATGLTDKQIAHRLHVSRRTVERRRKQIADSLGAVAGDTEVERMVENRHRHSGKRIAQALLRAGAGNGEAATLRGLLDAYPDLGVLTAEEMERLLTILAHKAPPNVQVQAIKLLDDLQRWHRPEQHGLDPPVTREERLELAWLVVTSLERDEQTALEERLANALRQDGGSPASPQAPQESESSALAPGVPPTS